MEPVSFHDLLVLLVSLISSGVVAGMVARSYERKRAQRILAQQLNALHAEIEYCAKLAATYLESNIRAPLYRFPSTVFRTVYPALLSEVLGDDDVTALTAFY